MAKNSHTMEYIIKQSASEVIDKDDVIVENDFENSIKNIIEKIEFQKAGSYFLIKIV